MDDEAFKTAVMEQFRSLHTRMDALRADVHEFASRVDQFEKREKVAVEAAANLTRRVERLERKVGQV